MRIVLIQPPKPVRGTHAEQDWRLTRPLCLFFLAEALERCTNWEVDILDFERIEYRGIGTEQVIAETGFAEVFGITGTTYTRFEAIRIAQSIKRLYPKAVTVVGGVHFTHAAADTLRSVREIDLVARNEGEQTIVELVQAFGTDAFPRSVKGITYRAEGTVVSNPEQSQPPDFDACGPYLKFSWEEYPEYLFGYPQRVRAVSLTTSRGCPYRCAFCAKAQTGYRTRSARRVVEEIELLMEHCSVDAFNFLDLTFTARPQHVRDVCGALICRGMDIKWWCESRANMPLDLLELMKRAGCVSIVVGVESGSPRVLSKTSKGITPRQAIAFCHRCKDLGIIVQPYFMYSLPAETRKDVERTLDLISRLEEFTEPCSFQPAMVFPGTRLEAIARTNGALRRDFSWCEPYEPDLNLRLGQLANVPLFFDRLNEQDLLELMEARAGGMRTRRDLRHAARIAADMPVRELVWRGMRSVLTKRPSAHLAWSRMFYREWLMAKLTNWLGPR